MISELLHRWSELQPEWCDRDKRLPIFWVGERANPHPVFFSKELREGDWAVLQRVAQKAIAAKGFGFGLAAASNPEKEGIEYSADVYCNVDVARFFTSGIHEEAAIALLMAHIQALQAEKQLEVAA